MKNSITKFLRGRIPFHAKKIILYSTLAFILSFLNLNSSAQTNVSGGIFSNTTWTKANSPYIVTGIVVVHSGVTLTIEPGVDVKFDTNHYIDIRGRIEAVGTSTDSIRFYSNKANPNQESWPGFYVGSGSFKFHYVHVKHTQQGVYTGVNSEVKYCRFSNCNNGIMIYSNAVVSNSSFVDNKLGGYISGTLVHKGLIFERNERGADVSGEISECEFRNNRTGAEGSGKISKSLFINNHYAAFASSLTLKCNNFTGNDTAIISGVAFDNSNRVCDNHYNFMLAGSQNLNLKNICWCSSDSASIASKIIDGYDMTGPGLVSFMPAKNCLITTPIDSLCPAQPIGISDWDIENEFLLYPNPMSSFTTLKPAEPFDNSDVLILNSLGKLVQVYENLNGTELIIPRNNLSQGVYFIKIIDKDKSSTAARLIICD